MNNKKRARKFFTEPLLWVGAAMIGVVLMGPSAANLAKKVVGGNRDRGDVDEHGEALVSNASSDDSTSQPKAMPDEVQNLPSELDVIPGADNRVQQPLASDQPQTVQPQTDQPQTDQPQTDQPQTDSPQTDITVSDQQRDTEAGQSTSSADAANEAGEFDVDAMIEEIEDSVSRENSEDTSTRPLPMVASTAQDHGDDEAADVSAAGIKPGELKTGLDDSSDHETSANPKSSWAPDTGSEEAELKTVRTPASEESTPDQQNDTAAAATTPEAPRTQPPGNGPAIISNDFVGGLANTDAESQSEKVVDEPFEDEEYNFFGGPDSDFSRSGEPKRDSTSRLTAVEKETGDAWWAASVAQPFWPDRQAQFADLDGVVFAALQSAPFVQILNKQPMIEATFVQEAQAKFDWSAFVDASWNSTNEPVRSLLQTGTAGGRFEQAALQSGSGLKKRLAAGGELQVANTYGTVDNNSTFLSPPDQGLTSFALDYRQPLLRGRGREVAQSQIVLARINLEVQDELARQNIRQYLVDVVSAYWELYRVRGRLAQRNRGMHRASEVVARLSRQGMNKNVQRQMDRANAAVASRQSDLIAAEYAVANAQEHLMNLTHGVDMPNPDQVELIPMEIPPECSVPHNLDSVTQLAIQHRPEVKAAFAEIKASSLRQTIAYNDLKPQLDAIISSYVLGLSGDKDVGHAYYNQFSAGDPSYSVGLSFEVPLGRRAANAQVQRRELEQQLLQNKLRKTLGDVTVSARTAYRDVHRLLTTIQNNRLAARQAATELNGIEKHRDLLLGSDQSASLHLNDLLLSQQRLAVAEQNVLDSQAELAMAYVRLKYATGELLQEDSMGCVGDCNSGGCQVCQTPQPAASVEPNRSAIRQVIHEQPVMSPGGQPGNTATQISSASLIPASRYPLTGGEPMSFVPVIQHAGFQQTVEPAVGNAVKQKPVWKRLLRK